MKEKSSLNGAMPGLIMPATPHNGMKYQQEFAEGVAEGVADDMAIVINTKTRLRRWILPR